MKRQLDTALRWAFEGGDAFLAELDRLPDTRLGASSVLPGWTQAHVSAHVGFNAHALLRLAEWARTGVETPMYADQHARNAQIAHGARMPGPQLRAFVSDAEDRLRRALDEMPVHAWAAKVRTAQGRWVGATEIPWLRAREVWVHAADLGGEMTFDLFPPPFVDQLLTDITTARERRCEPINLRFEPTDRECIWTLGSTDGDPLVVHGTAAALCRWLAGRGHEGVHADDALPRLGSWL